nr:hypothetical protein [Providencia heimbachae]
MILVIVYDAIRLLRDTRHISRCGGVGFTLPLGSHTCVCFPSCLRSPPCHSANYLEYLLIRHISRCGGVGFTLPLGSAPRCPLP